MTTRLKLDLELILPESEGTDPCVERLLGAVRGLRGVVEAHLDDRGPEPRLCLHYDPERLSVVELEAAVRSAGADLVRRFGHARFPLATLRHERHARLVEEVLAQEPGVIHAAVSFSAKVANVEYEPGRVGRARLAQVVADAGATADAEAAKTQVGDDGHDHGDHGPDHKPKETKHGPGDGHAHRHDGPLGEHAELIFSLICGGLALGGWVAGKLGAPPFASKVAFWLACAFGGWFTVKEAVLAIRAKKFEIDFLMLVAAGGAGALGEWFEGALLLFLFSLGHSLEGFAMGRARKAIEALAKMVPDTALLIADDGTEREVPVAEVKRGARVRVKPHTRVPCDGIVAAGTSSVDQAPITGESVPVDKSPPPDLDAALRAPDLAPPAHRVFAGTINGGSALTVVVTRASTESTLARVVELVSQADAQKSPTQQFTDRFERVFVPVVLALVAVLLCAGFVLDEPFRKTFYRAMAVLVAASPCALAIATPSAVLAGVARAARGGVLVKGGAHLESLGAIETFAFDKTGTLTEGKPKLTDVVSAAGVAREELLRVALAVERLSDHPLARAVVEGATDIPDVPEATDVEAIVGHGVKARIGGKEVLVGKPSLFDASGGLPADVTAAVERLRADGRTLMVVGEPGRVLGVLGVMDTPRESAKEVLKELLAMGIKKTLMLSGDHQGVADAVARQVGLTEARGNLLPEDKVRVIDELAKSGSGVAMVGDGVNDAPALARSTVGIAMGAGGSDVALETADIALMGDDLRALPFAVGLSRACRRIIRQNLWASLGMVAFLIPATIFGFAGIGVAVVLHEGSTLLVVANALRLLAYGDPRRSGPTPAVG
ncbi:MAG: heavy metal translocating P-type ATPase [Deltaproteobacteria bacterium]|nr:heavy metal translocating P-type ATPase [Deltaproteobacteria bacterium]